MKRTGKIFTRILGGFLLIIALVIVGLYVSGNGYIFSAFRKTMLKGYSTAYIDDYVDFDNAVVRAGTPQPWELHEKYNQLQLPDSLRKELEDFQSVGFAVIQDGKLLYEEYWENYSDSDLTNAFSMAKSITTLLLGKAIEQGYIKGLDQRITDFIPEFLQDSLGRLATIGDLASMRSGFDWTEDYYSPLNMTAEAYYGDHIEKQLLKRHFSSHPGGHFKYLSANTELLAIILKRATGKNLAQYLSEEFWQPMGMENDALWSLSGGLEKSFCCFYSNVRDYAKLGQLLLQKGNWKGVQLLDSAFVERMITPCSDAFLPNEPKKYGYSIWIDENYHPSFYGMIGHLGQRILIVPDKNLVIVRLGKAKDTIHPSKGPLDADTYLMIDGVMDLIK
ncbi:MAG: beta-lactamase family protein [Candidatus Azobacteroides sp.]|nr:beta-lactamase family protein [Candidatus Azobacteroides sp.]